MALALGIPDPDWLLDVLSSEKLAEWEAFYRAEPFGYDADNLRFALVASTVANFSEISKRHDWKLSDFMPHTAKRKLTVAEQVRATLAPLVKPKAGLGNDARRIEGSANRRVGKASRRASKGER